MPYTVPFLSKQAIAVSVQQWLLQYHLTLEAPVDIEDIMELNWASTPFRCRTLNMPLELSVH